MNWLSLMKRPSCMNETPRKYILTTLNKACREKIEIARQQYMAAFEAAAKNQPFEQLMQLAAEVLSGIGDQFDMNKMIEKIAEENLKKPVEKDNYSVKTPEGMLDAAPSIDTTELISAVAEGKE